MKCTFLSIGFTFVLKGALSGFKIVCLLLWHCELSISLSIHTTSRQLMYSITKLSIKGTSTPLEMDYKIYSWINGIYPQDLWRPKFQEIYLLKHICSFTFPYIQILPVFDSFTRGLKVYLIMALLALQLKKSIFKYNFVRLSVKYIWLMHTLFLWCFSIITFLKCWFI